MNNRLKRLEIMLEQHQLSAMLVTKPENRLYLSGFTGSAGVLIISQGQLVLFTDSRYIEQATQQASDFKVINHGPNLWKAVAGWLKGQRIERLGFENDFFTVELYDKLQQSVENVTLCPVKLDTLRVIKDTAELVLLEKAAQIADQAFQQIIPIIKPGVTEREIAVQLEYRMRQLGSIKPAFDTILASGPRGSLPHGLASERKIAFGDFVTLDFGAVYEGYHSDMTRTICVGKASDKQKEIYRIVLAAQLAGIDAVKSGQACDKIDAAARQIITDAGYGAYFGHGLGHSVGLAIHEEPRFSPNCLATLAENMVISVEPGIYLPGFGGVRIEDVVVVTGSGCRVLTTSSKELIELDCN